MIEDPMTVSRELDPMKEGVVRRVEVRLDDGNPDVITTDIV